MSEPERGDARWLAVYGAALVAELGREDWLYPADKMYEAMDRCMDEAATIADIELERRQARGLS